MTDSGASSAPGTDTGSDDTQKQPTPAVTQDPAGKSEAGSTSKGSKPRHKKERPARKRGTTVIAVLALLIALAAGLAAAWLWYRGQQRIQALNERVDTVEQGLESNVQNLLLPRMDKLHKRSNKLAKAADKRDRKLATLRHDLDRSRVQISSLVSKVEGGHRRWQLLEVESLLMVANERLLLYHAPADAIQALQLAGHRLGLVNDPRLFGIRQQIVNEIAALNALPQPDIQGVSLKLSSLIKRVPDLKLASHVPSNYRSSGQAGNAGENPSTGPWQHFKHSVGQALSALVTVRRTNTVHVPLMAPKRAYFLYQNLRLKLETARLALLQQRASTYSSAINTAITWLQTYFDTSDAKVAGAIRQLRGVRNVQLTWKAPDISASLTALRKFLRDNSLGSDGGTSHAHANSHDAHDAGTSAKDGA